MPESNEVAGTVLVTGATDGIGRETARRLLGRGACVLVHGHRAERLERTVEELRREAGDRVLPALRGDLARLDDVRAMAEEIRRRGVRVDVLVNNAGVFMNDAVRTVDGFETTWAVNHLAPFLLTHLLLDGGGPLSRIVNVSSDAHRHGRVDPGDPGGVRLPFDRLGSYSGSKLAGVLFTVELSRRVARRGITVNALHPGVVSTKLLTEGFGGRGPDSLEDAAAAVVSLTLGREVEGTSGRYFDRGRAARAAPIAEDRGLARSFYEASAAAVGVEPLSEG